MAIFDELKSLASTLRKADKINEYQLIIDVQEQLLEKQNKIIKLTEENRKLKQKDDFEKKSVFEKNAYYLTNHDGSKEGPYCSKCWDDENKKLRMQQIRRYNVCPKCKTCADL